MLTIMQNRSLNPKQARFLKLYTGQDTEFQGHATNSYRAAYGDLDLKQCQTGGSRLINSPAIKLLLDKAERAAVDRLALNATFVLNETVRLYDRCMGDEPIVEDITQVDQDTGLPVTTTVERRQYNPAIARQALEQIGRHRAVQAFQDNVEHQHTHYLESALMKRSQVIEARATDRDLPGPPALLSHPGDAPGQGDATGQGPALVDAADPQARPDSDLTGGDPQAQAVEEECLPAEVKPERKYTGAVPRSRSRRA